MKRVNLVLDLPELTAHADAHRLEQVLANLVDNAIKYGRAQGTVTIGGRRIERWRGWKFLCRTTAPAFRLKRSTACSSGSIVWTRRVHPRWAAPALAFSIVKHIVQSHGGRVWVKSEFGKGATFFFTLPTTN